jgi:phosphatidate cytidylyltransferase
MAFNWQTFKTRTQTATIFVVVMLAGLLINRWTFLILFSIIHFGCWWEYLKLIEKIYNTKIDIAIKYVLMSIGFVLFLLIGFPNDTIYVGSKDGSFNFKWLFYLFIILCITAIFFQNKKIPLRAKWLLALGFIYISLSLGLLISLYAKQRYSFGDQISTTDIHLHDTVFVVPPYFYPASIIASIWINDTMAYIIGSLIGKTQMSKISPKKTWEGTIGGIILSVVVIFLLSYFVFHFGILSYALMILAAIASIAGTFGDLLESKLKRMANVKDSGHIMPGHGGFLDRFDSLLIATPFVWLYVYFFL